MDQAHELASAAGYRAWSELSRQRQSLVSVSTHKPSSSAP